MDPEEDRFFGGARTGLIFALFTAAALTMPVSAQTPPADPGPGAPAAGTVPSGIPEVVEYAPLPPPTNVKATDTPNDGGRSVTLTWSAPEGAPADAEVIIERRTEGQEAVEVGKAPLASGTFVDAGSSQGATGPPDATPTYYALRTAVPSEPGRPASDRVESEPAVSRPQFFNRERWNVLLLLSTFFVFVVINIRRAASGHEFHIRKLSPVIAIEEAIGRATEMGRPVLYVPGIEDVEDIQTVASMGILGKVAEMTARYDVALRVPTARPFVMAVADEVVRAGCTQAGRPDAYQPDRIQFISTEQFAYCAGVNGIILREKPAANLYLGKFYAESLIFAETGFSAGSIQIAGTAEVTQLPFFIAACDYTLIGEEFFAAGAYLTKDPALVSTLTAADWAKLLLVFLLLTGAILRTAGMPAFADWFVVR